MPQECPGVSCREKCRRPDGYDSRDFLEELLKEPVPLFAYPNGKLGRNYLPKHVEMARELGFTAAVSTNWGVSLAGCDLYQLPRFTPWDGSKGRFAMRCWGSLRRPNGAAA